jgi:hypothetical protein
MRRIFPAGRYHHERQCRFYFTDTSETRHLVDEYLSGRLQDSLLAFRSAFSAVTQQTRKPRQ